MPYKKFALAAVIATIIILYFVGGGQKYLDIRLYQDLYASSPFTTAAIFFAVFFIGTACSLPVTGVLALISGVVFGTLTGFCLSSFATTLGGTVALYSTRFLFYELIERRFSAQVEMVNKGVKKEGALYLFGLRMVPVIPFWTLNLLMGLTSMPVSVFMLATFLGMMPVLMIFAYTGNQLGNIESFSLSSVLTPGLILALCLLATFPFLARLILKIVRNIFSNNLTK